jgi:general secretion pathway protein I
MRRQRGFTLLEIMISLAILGGALITLLSLSSSDIRASHKAKLVTIATGLARAKMLDLEEELYRTGFQETAEEMEGEFDDVGQPKFSWHATIEKVQLPAAQQLEGTEGAAAPPPAPGDEKNEEDLLGLAGGSSSGALGASMVQLYFPLIRPVLEAAIRKITLEVRWKIGKDQEVLKVISFYTDNKAIDQAIRASGLGGGAGGGGVSGSGGGGGTPPPPRGGGK